MTEPTDVREREPDATYRKALENALIHTAHLPHASRDLLEGLLASVARICKEALGIDTARTPEFEGDSEPTDVRELRAIAEPRFSPLFPEEVTALREAAAVLERLGELEEALRCEKCGGDDISTRYRAPGETLDGGIGTARSYFDRVEVECLRRCCRRCGFRWTDATLATPAPAPQQGGEND